MAVRPRSEEMCTRGGEKVSSGNVKMMVGGAVSVSAGWGKDEGRMGEGKDAARCKRSIAVKWGREDARGWGLRAKMVGNC